MGDPLPVSGRCAWALCLQAGVLGASVLLLSARPVSAIPSTTTTTTLPGECGNGVVEAAEDCDDGNAVAAAGQPCAADCRTAKCGRPTNSASAKPTAADALFALRTAVSSAACDRCICDVDDNGTVAAADALRLLRVAVGQAVGLTCDACFNLRRVGLFKLQDYFDVPVEAREELLLERDYIEGEGLLLSEDGARVSWPLKGAAGWWVRIGDAVTVTDDDGLFEIEVPAGGPTKGTIAHPQESQTPLFEIATTDLGPTDLPPPTFTFERNSFGPCGMNADVVEPDPALCSEIVPPQSLIAGGFAYGRAEEGGANDASLFTTSTTAPSVTGSTAEPTVAEDERGTGAHAHHHRANTQGGNKEPAFTTGPRGTYPAGGQSCCKDYDGGTYDGGTLHGVILNYYGSTCEKFVSNGCCAGELGSIKNSILSAVGLLTPKGCLSNHKGRWCQELKQKDISLDIDGSVSPRDSTTSPSPMNLGETKTFTIHNNGCFGETAVEKVKQEVGGIVSGDGYDQAALLSHKTGPTYVPDRTLQYTSPRCVGALVNHAQDEFRFSTDGSSVAVVFRMSPAGLYRFLPDGPVFSVLASNKYNFHLAGQDVCPGLHVHGAHPCTNAPDLNPGACGQGRVEPYTPPAPN